MNRCIETDSLEEVHWVDVACKDPSGEIWIAEELIFISFIFVCIEERSRCRVI